MTDANKWLVLAITIVTIILLNLLAPILTPFMVALILAYIGDPLVDRLQKWRLSRTWAVTTVFVSLSLLMTLAIVLLLPLLQTQINVIIQNTPGYVDTIQNRFLPWLHTQLGIQIDIDAAVIKQSLKDHWRETGNVLGTTLQYVSRSTLVLLGWLANLTLIPLVTFYLLRDWDGMIHRIHTFLPRRYEPVISRLARESDEVLGSFFRGQILVMIALAFIYSIGLYIIGLDLALAIGILAGIVSFVPYLGLIIGLIVATIAALMQFHDVIHVVYVLIVFTVVQLIEGMILTPKLIGNRIGLHPVVVIFAVMAGGQLFGFFGILLALPAAAVIMVLLRYLHQRYRDSTLYSHTG